MQGAPHRQARSSARSFFLLPSVLALLALALFPVSAFAGNSGETVYETEIPSVTSEPSTGGNHAGKSPTHHSSHNTGNGESGRATGSNAEVGGGAEGSEGKSAGHKKEGSSSQEEEGNPSTAGGGGGNKPNGGGGGKGPEGSISESKELGGTQPGANASHSSGGSSPVVPILIAVAVLAAISIGVVLYRQRKSGPGGSDGRVSSSNAS